MDVTCFDRHANRRRTPWGGVCRALFFAFVLIFVSCNPAKKFVVVDFDAPRMQGLTGLKGEVVVDSDSRRDLTVERAEIKVRLRGRQVASARLSDPVRVPAREVSKVGFRLELESVSLSALGMLGDRAGKSPDQITLDIDARVRHGGSRKKIKLRDVPLSDIIRTFEP